MNPARQIRLLVGGPANSGKSTFCTTLYRILRERPGVSVGLHEIDVYSDTHNPLLGKKPWADRRKNFGAVRADIIRRVHEFATDPSDIVIGDLPGNINHQHLPIMMIGGTHGIFLGSTLDDYTKWLAAFETVGIQVCWKMVSVINGSIPSGIDSETRIISQLDRRIRTDNSDIQAFADELTSVRLRAAS